MKVRFKQSTTLREALDEIQKLIDTETDIDFEGFKKIYEDSETEEMVIEI